MLNTSLPAYWLLLCLIIGLGYAYILYSSKKQPWSINWKRLFFILRTLVITLLCILFLEPFFEQNNTYSEPQKVVVLWDNSTSVSLAMDDEAVLETRNKMKQLADELTSQKEVELVWKDLSGTSINTLDSIKQDAQLSPLQHALDELSENDLQNKIAEVILVSDGIYNRGASPNYFSYPFTVNTLGLGDTIPKKDVSIESLNYNKVVYQGNRFPIVVEVTHEALANENVNILLKKDGKVISKELLKLNAGSTGQKITFIAEATNSGYQQYDIEIATSMAERNKINNKQSIFINVVEGKKKIVLLAAAPHPDIKALNQAITQNEQYDLKLAINQISPYEKDAYDLAILFHLPNTANIFQSEINALVNSGTAIWYIVGNNNMAINTFNDINKGLKISAWNDTDEANIYFNKNFKLFDLEQAVLEQLAQLPPAALPFANYTMNVKSEALFFKQIDDVRTEQPISVFYNDDNFKESTLLIEGFWKWRLTEYLQTERFEMFDQWIGKTVKWLTTLNKKNQLNVYPVKENFSTVEDVNFRVETYNELYEEIYGEKINLLIKNNDTTFNYAFTTDKLSPIFEVGALNQGKYTFRAEVTLNGKIFVDQGQFIVTENKIEELNLVADYNLLRNLALKNEGQFFSYQNVAQLEDYLLKKDYPKVLKNKKDVMPLAQNYWLFLIILILIVMEWFFRRYHGSY